MKVYAIALFAAALAFSWYSGPVDIISFGPADGLDAGTAPMTPNIIDDSNPMKPGIIEDPDPVITPGGIIDDGSPM